MNNNSELIDLRKKYLFEKNLKFLLKEFQFCNATKNERSLPCFFINDVIDVLP